MTTAQAHEDYDPCLYDPSLCEPDDDTGGTRRPSNRVMALRFWAAIFVRAKKRCVWCERHLRKPPNLSMRSDDPDEARRVYEMPDDAATVDHLDGDDRNNDPSNVIAACMECNRTRGQIDTEFRRRRITKNAARRRWGQYLRTRRTTIDRAEARIEQQRKTPIARGRMRVLMWPPGAKEQTLREVNSIWAPRSKTNKAQNVFAREVDRLLLDWRGERIKRIREKGSARAQRSRQMRLFERERADAVPFDV